MVYLSKIWFSYTLFYPTVVKTKDAGQLVNYWHIVDATQGSQVRQVPQASQKLNFFEKTEKDPQDPSEAPQNLTKCLKKQKKTPRLCLL